LFAGLCAGFCSILCVVKIPKPFTEVSAIALWAVITTDLLYEGNIGLSISKGCNRVLGTLAAGCLGFGLNQVGLQLGPVYPYFVVNFVIFFRVFVIIMIPILLCSRIVLFDMKIGSL